jgi:hypothetical protein
MEYGYSKTVIERIRLFENWLKIEYGYSKTDLERVWLFFET